MEELKQIKPLDQNAMAAAKKHWDAVAKPLGSLGLLEDHVIQLAGIMHTEQVCVSPRCVLVFCADNGVVAQGVSQSGQEMTAAVARALARGESNVNLMASTVQADVFAVDMGMAETVEEPNLLSRRISGGTQDIAVTAAMTRTQAIEAIGAGIDLVGDMKVHGYRMIATGEMGIGNTTTACAVACALLRKEPAELVGRGAGLSDAGLARKTEAIQRALRVNQPNSTDPIDVLCKVGGYDIAGLMGAFLGGAVHQVPIVIDGMISSVAALLAAALCPLATDYMLSSHVSREPSSQLILEKLGFIPIVHAGMALGEGTGALTLFPLLDMALRVYHGSHTFTNLGMDAYAPQGGHQ
ncbi:MAG: nicotinate-nucleotide--dimethylbenzimidazole phosphoribosyltransferase [Clostridiales bacterium]|nr:nicotinate-nucleotide--dimethylbenzimidazole phosphoribosyltransferase [Clostridiales bacterium]